MGFNAGELTAYADIDLTRFDRGVDEMGREREKFERKKWTGKVDVDTTMAQTKLGALSGLIMANSQQLQSAGMKMTAGITLPILAFDAYALKTASSLNEAQNKVNVVFGESSDAVLTWGQNAADAIGQSERQALSAAGTFGNLFVSMGMADQQSADMSMTLTNLASDLASFNDIDPTEALDALRSGLVGETEPMRRLGVNMNEATLRAKALEMGLDATGATLDPLVKAQAAYALIMEQTATAQGDFARTGEEVANSSRSVKAELEDMAAAWGDELLPVARVALEVAKPILDTFKELPGPIKQATVILGGLFAVIGPSLWMLGGAAEGAKALASGWRKLRAAFTTADTAAITANTAAVHANTAARALNTKMPPVGSGVVPQLLPNAAPAAGGLAVAGLTAAAATSALLTGAAIYYSITYEQPGESPNAANVTGAGAGAGRAGAASQAAFAADIRPKLDRNAEGIANLNEVISEINDMRPTADSVGATKVYEEKLKRLADQYPEIAGQIHAAAEKLREGAKAFEEASASAKAAADQLRQTIISEATSVFDAMSTARAAGFNLSATELQQVAEANPPAATSSYSAPLPNADNQPFPMPWPKAPKRAALGADFVTNGPELLLVGDNPSGREHVTVTPNARSGGVGPVVNLNVNWSSLARPSHDELRWLTKQIDKHLDVVVQRAIYSNP